MRRIKHSRLARTLSRTLIASLVFNSAAFMLLAPRQAEAQLTGTLPQWAVTDFVNSSAMGGTALAGAATDAFATNVAGTNQASVIPRESVDRGIRELSLTPPLTRTLDVIRLGQWLQVDVVFTGEVKDARIRHGGNGKSADVILVIKGIDVASGLPIMGAAVHGQSSERPGDVSDEVLLEEAVNYGAQEATRIVLGQQLEPATVIGTPGFGGTYRVKINKGARNGIKIGQKMIVTRGREQVGIIEVKSIEADSADAVVVKEYKGVAPGDRARVIFDQLPNIQLTDKGSRVRTSSKMNMGTALVGLLVIGVVAVMVGKEGGNATGGQFKAEAGTAPDNVTPAAVISWKPNLFTGGHENRIMWHVWRNDVLGSPVGSTDGNIYKFYDTTAARTFLWRDFGGVVGGPCADDPGTTDGAAPGTIPGTSYFYQLSLAYRVSCLNTPDGCAGGTVTDCFYETTRSNAPGQCTVIQPVSLLIPPNGATDVGNNVQFAFTAAAGAQQYAVEISTSPAFQVRGTMRVVARVETVVGGTVSTDPVNISTVFPGVQRLYWRAGARNAGDNPGPVPDPLNERYVWSQAFQFDRVILPPPPPVMQKGGR